MTQAERFRALMRFQPVDRLPRLEWAYWWDQTIKRWASEGLELSKPYTSATVEEMVPEITRKLGLDVHQQFFIHPWTWEQPKPAHHLGGILSDEKGYEENLRHFYPSNEWLQWTWDRLAQYQANMEQHDTLFWITVCGFFAWPRRLFGAEKHYYAFYDHPELMHRMNYEEAEFIIRVLRKTFEISRPVFVTIGEDMSYNGGPMCSREMFDEFIAPYYRRVVPVMKELGLIVFVDSDGNANELISWLADVGVEGLLPMERNAGSDVALVRQKHPDFLMIGNFEKLLMTRGEEAVRGEFERLLPVMKQGGFIPSPDHQTPPQVSLEQYRTYVRLLKEYSVTGAPAGRPATTLATNHH